MLRIGKYKFVIVAALAALVLAASFALAQEAKKPNRPEGMGFEGHRHGRHGKFGGPMGGGMMFRHLNLTDEQKAKMKQIQQSFQDRTQSIREALRAKHEELRQASEGDTFNEALATQKLTEAAALEAQLMGEQFKLRQEMLAVLTPEQKAQLEKARAEFKTKRGAWPGGPQKQ